MASGVEKRRNMAISLAALAAELQPVLDWLPCVA
jgi:hypothetical protein